MKVGDRVIGTKNTGAYGMCDFTKGNTYIIDSVDQTWIWLKDDSKIPTKFLKDYFKNSFYNIREGRMDKLRKINSYGCIE
jgi:hypothetical protein